MHLDAEITYSATPADVATMLADEAFHDEKCRRMKAVKHSVLVEGEADGDFTVTTSRTMPTTDFPDAARKFVGETVTIRQVDEWSAPEADGGRSGTTVVEIVGAPLRLVADQSLRAGGEGTVQAIDGDLKAAVPLVGGKLEKAAEPAILAAVRQENKVGREWLAR